MFAPRYAWAHVLALLLNLILAWLQSLTVVVGLGMYVCCVTFVSLGIYSVAFLRGAQIPVWEASATWSVLGTFALFLFGEGQPEMAPVPMWALLAMVPLSFLITLPVFGGMKEWGSSSRRGE